MKHADKMRLVIAVAMMSFSLFLSSAQAQKISIAVSNPDMSFLSGGVAKFKGFFKEEGLDAELVQISANVSIAALAGGQCRLQSDSAIRGHG